jgi:hypothetical protein
MKETKLIRLLKTFSKDEWKEFEKFAASPYFNNGRNFIPLVKELKKFAPEFDSANLAKENLYQKIYSGKPYKETVINTILSGLYNIAEEFLVHLQLKNLPERPAMLIKEFTKRKLFKDADKVIDSTGYTKAGIIAAENYNSITYNTKEILDYYILTDRRHLIPDILDTMFRFYIYDFINHTLTNRNIIQLNRKFGRKSGNYLIDEISDSIDLPKIIELIENSYESEALEVLSKYYNYAADNTDNEQYYARLKNLWAKYYNEMPLKLKVSFNISLVNICLRNISMGKLKFREEFRDIYKIILKENLYFISIKKPVFSNKLFKAILTNSIYLNETEWAEDFFGKYLDKVEPEFRENLHNYSMALIKFKHKKYDESLLFAGKIEQKQIIFKLDTKNITSKIYYETKSYENLLPLLDTYKQMILNNEVKNDIIGKSHLAFIDTLKKIVLAGKNETDYIKMKIEGTELLNSKEWLLEKITEP